MGDAAALPDGSFPIRCKADLLTAIELVGGDGDQHQAALHTVKRARALGLESELPGEGLLAEIVAGPAGSPTSKGTDPMTGKTEPAAGGGDLQKQLDDLRAENETLKKANATATAVAALSEPQRAHYGSLKGDEAKAAFLSKADGDRQKEIDDLRKGDPVLYKALDGAEFRASDGDRMISIAKRADDNARRLALSEAQRSQESLAKRADTELDHCPGTVEVRSALLKAVDGIGDEATRTGVLEILKAGNTAMATTSKPRGIRATPAGGGESANAELDRLAKAYMEKNPKVNYYDAYAVVSEANPALLKRAIAEPDPIPEGA